MPRFCRAPRGARGLKSDLRLLRSVDDVSCPSRGTWIEMLGLSKCWTDSNGSCPSRGTWIEIVRQMSWLPTRLVVPLAGHVD